MVTWNEQFPLLCSLGPYHQQHASHNVQALAVDIMKCDACQLMTVPPSTHLVLELQQLHPVLQLDHLLHLLKLGCLHPGPVFRPLQELIEASLLQQPAVRSEVGDHMPPAGQAACCAMT